MNRVCLAPLALMLMAFPPLASFAQELKVTPEKAAPLYAVNEPIVWNIQVSGEGAEGIKEVHYEVKSNAAAVITSGVLPLQNGAARLESHLGAAGTLLGSFSIDKANRETARVAVGAAIEPFKIEPSRAEPADFETFWKSKIAELEMVPQNPVIAPEPSGTEGIGYWKISLDNIRGTHVQGQIARPALGEKFPALVRFQAAGIYALDKSTVVNAAKNGWLTLNINAHDLPIDQTSEFYKAQNEGPLKNYMAIGDTDREKSYFLRMVLGCYRAVEYLKTRPDWDGKTMVVEGSSQGGMQSLMVGGLNSDVTAVIANIPAGCDTTGPTIGRAMTWPFWWARAKNNPAVLETSRYYDALNFARHITVPTLIAVGLLDTISPAPGVLAAFNQIPSAFKKLVIMPQADHAGKGGTQDAYYRDSALWLQLLSKGEPIPTSTN